MASDGSVTGTELLRTANTPQTYSVQGTYIAASDDTISLSLNATSTDTFDAGGNPLSFAENLKLVAGITGEFATLRTDPGLFTTGVMMTSAPNAAKGTYLLNGKPIDPANTSVDVVRLDGAGNVSGAELLNSFSTTSAMSLTGSYVTQANGFGTLTLSTQSTDADGNPVVSTETYAYLATQKDVKMLRADGNSAAGILTLTQ